MLRLSEPTSQISSHMSLRLSPKCVQLSFILSNRAVALNGVCAAQHSEGVLSQSCQTALLPDKSNRLSWARIYILKNTALGSEDARLDENKTIYNVQYLCVQDFYGMKI